jgi:hypothetical protein
VDRKMTSQRQLFANRKNSTRSTGPRTEQGKTRSSQNAVRHGLARKFGQEAVDLRKIEKLAGRIASEHKGIGRKLARAAAVAELELARIRDVQAETWGLVAESVEKGLIGDTAGAISKAERLERYEKRAVSRRKKVVRRTFVVE